MGRILAFGAILIWPFMVSAQALDSETAEEASSDRVLDYIAQVRDQHEGKTIPPPAVQRQSRKEILDTLSPLLTTRDTPRGVVVSIPPTEFEGGKLRPDTAEKVALAPAMVVAHPAAKEPPEGYPLSENPPDSQLN